ncbi:MAG: polysaccharide deacetylase family protein, partial [Proteobacteria bacterium]|nr:polysaccharide deacetylase family protein [Pseudomonadota bacterium]
MNEIPILLYHNIGNYPEYMMEDGMLPETFEKQMKFLAENGYQIVTLNQALAHMNRKTKLPSKAMAITIDGGYQDAFTNVYPVLKKYGFKATFFIPPKSIGKERIIGGEPVKCMNWDEVCEIRNSGMEIGLLAYHGRSIRLNNYNEHAIKESILPALKIMGQKINPQVKYCAFREGVPQKPLWHFLQGRDFEAVFTQCPTNRRAGVDGIGRIQIDDDDHNIFLTKISKTYL